MLLSAILIVFTMSDGLASNSTSTEVKYSQASKKKTYCIKLSAFDFLSESYLNNWTYVLKNFENVVIAQGNVPNGTIYISNLKAESYQVEASYCGFAFKKDFVFRQFFEEKDTATMLFLYMDTAFTITGKAIDCSSNKPFSNKEVVITEFNKKEEFKVATDSNGNFYVRIANQYNYHVLLNADSCFPLLQNVYLSDKNRLTIYNVSTEICANKIECNKEIKIPYVAIDLERGWVVKGEGAQPELDKLFDILKKNPTFKIEIMVHSDCRSSADYNLDATQRLADEIKAYLVTKGIDSNRLFAKGYGESQLLNHCTDGVKCTELEHAVNKRRLFKLICE